MSDLCAPIYVVTGADEVMTFWCFVSVMERMVGPLAICVWNDVLMAFIETKLLKGSEWNEEATSYSSATSRCYGP